MTDAAAAPDRREPRRLTSGWSVALRHGLLAAAAILALGEGLALLLWMVSRRVSLAAALRIGWFEVAAVHRIPLRVSATGLDVSGLTAGSASLGRIDASMAVAPLLLTAFAFWLLRRGGRALANVAGGSGAARVLHGMMIAPFYAVPMFALALLVGVRERIPVASFVSGTVEIQAAPLPALVLPLVLAATAGAAGGLSSAGRDRDLGDAARLRATLAVVEGGAWMLVLGLGLSYAGLFLTGVFRPDGAEAYLTPTTGRYYRTVFDRPVEGLAILAHQLAVAPNEAMWALVPAMGGCTGVYPSQGEPVRLLCLGHFPLEVALPAQIVGTPAVATPPPRTRFGTAPDPYLLFLLAPAIASVLGGRWAAERADLPARRAAVIVGAGAGLMFAVLVVVVGWLASIGVSGSVALGTALDASGAARIGPGLVGGGLLGLAWGVLGGALGAATVRAAGSTSSPARGG